MKKLCPLLSILFLIYWSCEFKWKEKVVVYHDNGQVKSEGMKLNNGDKVGKWVYFYENGDVLKEEEYKNGKLNGLFRQFFPNGNISVGGSYKDGLKTGPWLYNKENGERHIFEFEYKEGKLDGYMSTYNEMGETELMVSYSNGEITNKVLFQNN
jgi:antitoxin component YwqK of YwqJK toxin-antitoxin module|tara:strand:- start:26 stop:487 length:462 start_codon:yes stop_codon:yes gene_type:complete